MYKPPENSNRVKDIKDKFERSNNLLKNTTTPNGIHKTNGKKSVNKSPNEIKPVNTKGHYHNTNLSRQLSDPNKCNIKRTPAFRLDPNVAHVDKIGDETGARLLNSKLRYHDNNNDSSISSKVCNNVNPSTNKKVSTLTDTKLNFSELRNKFDSKLKNTKTLSGSEGNLSKLQLSPLKQKTEPGKSSENLLKYLYSSPLPKSQRPKKEANQKHEHKSDDESTHVKTTFVRNSGLYGSLHHGLTDTLKNALKKPLPKGPPPKKPPRTFAHCSPNTSPFESPTLPIGDKIPKNSNKKNFAKQLNTKLKRNLDAKYMLDKLELAIKNKGVLKKPPATPKPNRLNFVSSTSEEESDENDRKEIDVQKKNERPSKLELSNGSPDASSPSNKFSLSCLPSLSCTNSTYQKLKQSNSFFFVPNLPEEPVYAEPFEYQPVALRKSHNGSTNVDECSETVENKAAIRRSVHYASSPVSDIRSEENKNVDDILKMVPDQIFDSTSLSSASTSDSMASSPSEENCSTLGINVRDIIRSIETNHNAPRKAIVVKTTKQSLPLRTKDFSANDSRIKNLEDELKNTLDKCFSNGEQKSSEHEDEGTSRDELVTSAKFSTYVKRVRSCVYKHPVKKALFDCCLLVALNRNVPYVKSKFPESVQEPHKIADLCFPEVESDCMNTSVEAQCYSLIITNEVGERTFGYCRRVLPEDSTDCLPLAYCLLSKYRAPGFYRRILEELECRHGYPDKFKNELLEKLYKCSFPGPGETIVVNCTSTYEASVSDQSLDDKSNSALRSLENSVNNSANLGDSTELDLKSFVVVFNDGEYGTLLRNKQDIDVINNRSSTFMIDSLKEIHELNLKKSSSFPNLLTDDLPSKLIFNRPYDSRHEENDLNILIKLIKTPILQKVFSSLLLERKVIFVSEILGRLSSCIDALQIILYPFLWQHTIIPVIPKSLWEIVDTPTPLVAGVLSSDVVEYYSIENALVVNLDEGKILLQVGDEDSILPHCLVQTLREGLRLAESMISNNTKNPTYNIYLSDAFLRVFIQSCGHYKEHLNNKQFMKDEFIRASKYRGKHVRQFLKWFTETTMFDNFIQAAGDKSNSLDLFEQRMKIYCSESVSQILDKLKGWAGYKNVLSPNLTRFQ